MTVEVDTALPEPKRGRGTRCECDNCGAALLFAGERTATCPYCKSPSVLERPASKKRPNPAFVLPFVLTEARARDAARRWTKQLRLTKKSLDAATLDEGRGLYLPAYLYSGVVRAAYTASIGENYTETQTYTVVVNGKRQTRTRTVVKTEWRSLAGEHAAYATDLLVTASRGLSNPELEHVEPFDLRLMRRYAHAFVSGWIVEEPSIGPKEGKKLARAEAQAWEERQLVELMPGDKHGDLAYSMSFHDEAVDLVLVPIWVLALRPSPEAPVERVLVNGQTGEVWGPEHTSWLKVIAWCALAVGIVGLVALLAQAAMR